MECGISHKVNRVMKLACTIVNIIFNRTEFSKVVGGGGGGGEDECPAPIAKI